MKIRDKHMDLRRMEAQRNELNAKGRACSELSFSKLLLYVQSQLLYIWSVEVLCIFTKSFFVECSSFAA